MKKNILLSLAFTFLFTAGTLLAQAGTSISYSDDFGSANFTNNGSMQNGKFLYEDPAGSATIAWNSTLSQWEVKFFGDCVFFSTVATATNPPDLDTGNWMPGPDNSGESLTRLDGDGSTSIILPVTLTDFHLRFDKRGVVLLWATSSESGNDRFEVERSEDGRHFREIGWVAGNGNTNDNTDYEYIDDLYQPGTQVYYRLRQVDFDGAYAYSPVITYSGAAGATTPLALVNNLVTAGRDSELRYRAAADGQVRLVVADAAGRQVSVTPYTAIEGFNRFAVPTTALQTGMYFVQLREASGTLVGTQRLMVR